MKAYRTITIFFLSIILCGIMLIPIAYAQEESPEQQDTGKQLFLSLEEAINIALQNNLDIRIQELEPKIKQEDIEQAEAAFDSGITNENTHTFTKPATDNQGNPTGITNFEAGIGKRFTFGGSYQVTFKTSRTTLDDVTTTVTDPATGLPVSQTIGLDDRYSTGLELSFRQPLMKNRGSEVNTTMISIARKNKDMSVSDLRSKVIDNVSQVKNTYWRLVLAIGDLEAKRLSLQLAYDLVKINQAQVDVGTLAPIEILQAQATAAYREVKVIEAEQAVQDVEDEIKRLLNISGQDPVWRSAIIPTDAPLSAKQPVSLNESVRIALENNEGLVKLRKVLEIQELNVNSSENQLLPEVNAISSVGVTGQDKDLGGSVGEFAGFDSYSFTVGMNVNYPLGNNAAKKALNKAKLELEKARLSLQNTEQLIITNIKKAVRGVETSYKLVEATKIARELAEEQLDAEQKKFNEGLSTNFQVLNYQDSLETARTTETQAITGYNQALVALDQITGLTLQKHNIVVNE